MNSKERVLRTINRKETYRVPLDFFGISDETIKRIRGQMNLNSIEDVYRNLEIDLWCNWSMGDYSGARREYKGLENGYLGSAFNSHTQIDSS